METKVHYLPVGYHSIMPYMTTSDASKAIEFYKRAFGATERMRLDAPGGKVGHAEIVIGDMAIMIADENPASHVKSPQTLEGSSVGIHLYVENVDSVIENAVLEGATLLAPAEDRFYGDRNGSIRDPFGHIWNISTHIEDVPLEEVKRQAVVRT